MSGKQELWRQYVASLVANLGMLNVGILLVYASPISPHLLDGVAPVKITESDNSWFTSSMTIGSTIGSATAHVFLDRWGRRGTFLLSTFPLVFGWAFLLGAQNLAMLLVGRVVHGLFTGILLAAVPPYVGEISDPSIRGRLGGFFGIALSLGYIFMLGLGGLIKHFLWLSAAACLPAVLFLLGAYFFVPESPVYLIAKNREEEAEISLQKLNGEKYDVSGLFSSMKAMVQDSAENTEKSFSIKMFKEREVYEPFVIIFLLIFFLQFSGYVVFLFNLFLIFSSVGVDVSSDLCSVIFALVFLAATVASTVLLDRSGRKILLLISFTGAGIGLVFLGFFFFFVKLDEWKNWIQSYLWWLPILSILLFIFSLAFGAATIPYILIGEYFPPNCRMTCSSILCSIAWLFVFIVTFSYVEIKNAIGITGVYWMYSICCFTGVMYTVWAVPETKGKPAEDITTYFRTGKFPRGDSLS